MTGDPYAPWYEHTFVIFDVETTGLEDSDRIVELGLARFEGGELVKRWGSREICTMSAWRAIAPFWPATTPTGPGCSIWRPTSKPAQAITW